MLPSAPTWCFSRRTPTACRAPDGSPAAGYNTTFVAGVLDIGCGRASSAVFPSAMRLRWRDWNIDVDRAQVELGRALGLNLRDEELLAYLQQEPGQYRGVACLDVP